MHRWSTTALALTLFLSVPALAAMPRASSELTDSDNVRHGAALAFDGLLTTGWAEGDDGDGAGSWVELRLDQAVVVKTISIWPGNLKLGRRSLREFSRPRTVNVVLQPVRGEPIAQEVRLQDGGLERVGPQRVDIEFEGQEQSIKSVRVEIVDTYEGGVFRDMFITEIAVNFDAGTEPRIIARLKQYQDSPAGAKARKANREEVVELFTKVKSAEFGDRDSLGELMDRAGDGPPYLRRQLSRVPAGYRVQALPPDPDAIEALQKLEDANAIPAFEMAALRSAGKRQKRYELMTEYFYALQELIGGGDRNIPFWGKEGWEPGAFRSFGEPLALEADQYGDLYIADLGNHRLQRFTSQGRHDRLWGSEPAITNAWFQGKRRYYVSGAAPGEKPGQFHNPVAIDMIPGKDNDGFVVLDAKGRVQIFNEEGQPIIGWTVRSRDDITPNVGGEGYIKYVKNKIVVVWGNEIFVYGMDSEELDAWKTEDGVPNGAEVLKNGKLVLIFGEEAIMYSVDGYRHGTIMNAEEIGPGIEDWDITVDEDNKIWVITDTGYLAKYKKPGKMEYVLQVSDVDLIRPRLAVFDGIAYIMERDRILKVDALKLKKEKDLAEEEAEKADESGESAE